MRLLMVTTVPVTIEAFLEPFAKHFRSQGWRVDGMAAGLSGSPSAGSFDRVHDVEWSRNPLDPRNLGKAARQVREAVSGGDYDIVHVHTPVAAFVTRWALRRRTAGRPKVVYTAHGFHFAPGLHPLRNALFLGLEKLAGRWTDALVVINADDLEAARRHRIVPPERLRFIHGIGVDTDLFDPARVSAEDAGRLRRELGVGEQETLVTMIAEFVPQKRQADVLRALSRADESIRLAFAGVGPTLDACRALARDLGVEERVRFLGWRSDIPVLIAASEATVLFSDREGLPRSVMESLAMETPVIGPDIRGVRDLLEGGCGILVPPADVDALATALDRVAGDGGERQGMGRRGRQKMLGVYSFRAVLAEHEKLYDGLL